MNTRRSSFNFLDRAFRRAAFGSALLLLMSGCASSISTQAPAPQPVPVKPHTVPLSRLRLLTRGYNVDSLRGNTDNPPPVAWFKELKREGYRNVRLVVGAKLLFDEENPERLRPAIGVVKKAIGDALQNGLACIVDVHDADARLWTAGQDDYVERFARFWRALASEMKAFDAERVFLEVANEPAAEEPQLWNRVQARIVAAMREGAPRHTIIADGNMRLSRDKWDGMAAFEGLAPVADRNVVYSFHFYEPFVFTHQGATWGWDVLKDLKDIPYPSTPENVVAVMARSGPQAHDILKTYGEERWDARKIEAQIARAAAWGKTHQAPVHCGEFGAAPWSVPKDSALRWYGDVRAALEKHDIPWAIWFTADAGIRRQLGLNP